MALTLREIPDRNDDLAIERFSRAHPGWRFEYDASGAFSLAPTSSDGAAKDLEAGVQLRRYADRVGGKAFGSAAGFRLADGSLRSPDASWISAEHIARLSPEQKTKFWKTCPDVIVEILSDTDSWSELMQKVDQYCKNGSAYVIAIDPYRNRVEVRGEAPPGLEIDIAAIVNA